VTYLDGLSLGKDVTYVATYSADLLQPIPRQQTRDNLQINNQQLPFNGGDYWNAYEISWLNSKGLPQVVCGVFYFPCDSAAIIESKSFKLYLNAFNQSKFESKRQVTEIMQRDLSTYAGAEVTVELLGPSEWQFSDASPSVAAINIDQQDIEIDCYQADQSLLVEDSEERVSESLQSNLLRSLCPVTGQPDWACLMIKYQGQKINHEGLLRYIVSFREHQEFHEQCVERIYTDLQATYQLSELTVYARYVRRGGLDINPYRSSADTLPLNTRSFRQ
jgi:7-cyano-7-deazaguanine reductase